MSRYRSGPWYGVRTLEGIGGLTDKRAARFSRTGEEPAVGAVAVTFQQDSKRADRGRRRRIGENLLGGRKMMVLSLHNSRN